jgi:hypothetical protein
MRTVKTPDDDDNDYGIIPTLAKSSFLSHLLAMSSHSKSSPDCPASSSWRRRKVLATGALKGMQHWVKMLNSQLARRSPRRRRPSSVHSSVRLFIRPFPSDGVNTVARRLPGHPAAARHADRSPATGNLAYSTSYDRAPIAPHATAAERTKLLVFYANSFIC